MYNENYLKVAITLARLYGIAETLHPWNYLENEKFLKIIRDWTEEYIRRGEKDILRFFESKTIQ